MGMKDVNIIEALLKEYSDKDLVHYCSQQLNFIARSISKEATPENMYRQMGAVLQLNEYLKAVDQRMNRLEKSAVVQ